MSTSTKFPVVFVHGVFGFGKQRPLWNYWAPYWPERELRELNDNHLIVDVGSVSSDHDRACEAFYQLVGGRVDYGEQHAREKGHARYGETFTTALHPDWSADRPVHFVGHSFGSTTAMELYQLLCVDFFGVGSSHRWVKSLTCIAGPLTGSTLGHMLGFQDGKMVGGGPMHVLAIVLGLWLKLYSRVPSLKKAADLHMDHWKEYSIKDVLSVDGPVNATGDTALHGTLPEHRIARNAMLKHMDKLHLLSITTSPRTVYVPISEVLALVTLVGLRLGRFPRWWPQMGSWRSVRTLAGLLVACYLYYKLKRLDVSKMPSMYGLKWLIRRRAKQLPMIFDGFEPRHWEKNDGVVNIRSMLRPWFPKPQELAAELTIQDHPTLPPSLPASASSSSLQASIMARCASHISIDTFHRETEDDQQAAQQPGRFDKGRWYVYRVDSNHLAGTYWDADAADLYKSLFTLMVNEYERGDACSGAGNGDSERQSHLHVANRPASSPFG